MAEILANLLENAFRYTPPGTAVGLHCDAGEHGLALTVWDGGEPIDPAPEVVDLARRAAQAVQTSFVGIDLLPAEDGQVYVLEVNAVPGWRELARCLNRDVSRIVLNWLQQQVITARREPSTAAAPPRDFCSKSPR